MCTGDCRLVARNRFSRRDEEREVEATASTFVVIISRALTILSNSTALVFPGFGSAIRF